MISTGAEHRRKMENMRLILQKNGCFEVECSKITSFALCSIIGVFITYIAWKRFGSGSESSKTGARKQVNDHRFAIDRIFSLEIPYFFNNFRFFSLKSERKMKIYIDFFEIMCYNEHKLFQLLLQNANYVANIVAH